MSEPAPGVVPVGEPALTARGVRVTREGRALVDGVDLTVSRGAVHAIIGPNGAGKSTLLAALLGHVDFEGEVKLHARSSGRVGYVPQAFPVDRTLPVTVIEFLALSRQRWPICLGVKKALRAPLEALLERVGLGGFGARRLGSLSGGELQRVLLANAIDPEPELLFLDEPASGLDATSEARLEDLVDEARGRGVATVIVSHDAAQVHRIADAVTWLDVKVQKTGTVADVFGDEAQFPFTRVARPTR
ncbi:MAG: metal ABC transporter ATP-binding protein [Polyangiaceae bacterium]